MVWPRLLILSAAIAPCFNAAAVDYTTSVIAKANEEITLNPGDTVLVPRSWTLAALGGVVVADGVAIGTSLSADSLVHGAWASAGGTVRISNSSVNLRSSLGMVGSALGVRGAGSTIEANNVQITSQQTEYTYTGTVNAQEGGRIALEGGRVECDRNGLAVQGPGSRITANATEVHSGVDGTALAANGVGAAIVGSNLVLAASNRGTGVIATQGGAVLLNDSTLTLDPASGTVFSALDASGNGSGIQVTGNSTIVAQRNASGSATVNARDHAFIYLQGGRLESAGSALLATGTGSRILSDGTRIASGFNGTISADQGGRIDLVSLNLDFLPSGILGGVNVDGSDSEITLAIVTMNNGMLRANSGATLKFDHSSVITNGGVFRLMGDGTRGLISSATVNAGVLESEGGYVVDVNSAARFEATNSKLVGRNGLAAVWLPSDDSTVKLTDTSISTFGTNGEGHGIQVQGGLAEIVGGAIDNFGDGTFGLYLTGSNPPTTSSRIITNGLSMTSYGNNAGGAFVEGVTARLDLIKGSINTVGENSWGIVQQNLGGVSIADAHIRSEGLGSGVYRSVIQTTGTYENSATFTRSSMETINGTALSIEGSNHALSFIDSTVIARRGGDDSKGALLLVNDWTFSNGGNNFRSDTGQVRIIANNTRLVGDVQVASPTARVSIDLVNGSTLEGALTTLAPHRVSHLGVEAGSRWNIRGESALHALDHAGILAFIAPTQDDFKTLTVTGNYVGDGGTWLVNQTLGDDASAGDRIVIEGNSSGNATVSVLNAGGVGAATREGIRLINVGGQSNAQFSLSGRVVAGAYDYLLFKGGISTPHDGNWYLRSTVVPSTPPQVTPVDPPVAPQIPALLPEPPKIERPEPTAYLGNQIVALRMFQHSLHDRTSDPRTSPHDTDADHATAWAFLRSDQLAGRDTHSQVQASNQTDSLLLGVGRALDTRDGGSLQVGVMGGQGRAHSHGTSQVSGYHARGEIIGTSLGVYGTWLQDTSLRSGFYADGWLQYGRFRNNVHGDGLQQERYRSRTWTGSIEAGYALPLRQGDFHVIYLEPQLQLLRRHYDADRVTEANGTVVESARVDGNTTRLGARLYTRSSTQRQGQVHPFVAVNWWSGGNASAIAVDGERLQRNLSHDIYEAKVGLQVDLSGAWRGWGQFGHQMGEQGYRDTNAQIGMSLSW
ncbi:autotransporter outer membrane beta-barrel domain-containing protein [Stenotrophomonas lactitubi]|uniref:autotransporter outer membrane beta-barrel domain-containing protein n=1 Tax=Stenotrophomonas lactitubi TaxID=2045214 RepID=UPI00320A7F66